VPKVEAFAPVKGALQEAERIQQSAFDRLFGEESRISSFFEPSIRQTEELISDIEADLGNLEGDIVERFQDVGLTTAQQTRVTAKERGALTKQLEEATRSFERLTSGLDIALDLSDREFNAVIGDAQTAVDSALQELEATDISEAEFAVVEAALNEQLQQNVENRQEERTIAAEIRQEKAIQAELSEEEKLNQKAQVNTILQEALNFVVQSGVQPSEAFLKVVRDANALLEGGATLSEIQLGVMQAITGNQQVREFIKSQFDEIKPGSGSGTSSGFFSDEDFSSALDEFQTESDQEPGFFSNLFSNLNPFD